MEYVRVDFDGSADVYIDEQRSGSTNQTLYVEAGHHTFALGDAQSSASPPPQDVVVEEGGSTVIDPLIVTFPGASV